MSLARRSSAIGEPIRDAEWWRAQLVVDDSDPVFFDHGVDHVPGMLMLHGIGELVERASSAPFGDCAAGVFDLDFTRFVEKDSPADIAIAPADPPGAWRLEMTQSDRVVCAGTVRAIALDGYDHSTVSRVVTAAPGELAEAALVHRRRTENIVVSPLRTVAGGYAVDYEPSEVVRTKRFEHVHCPLDVVEAGRQFMILLSHTVCGFDLHTHLILNHLIVSMPQPVSRAAAVRLHSGQPQVNRGKLDFTIRAYCDGQPVATIKWYIKAVTPAVYARLRGVLHE